MTRETIVTLYRFIDVIMDLPTKENDKLFEEIINTAEEKKMQIMSTAERIGRRRGREEGREEGRVEARIELLQQIRIGVKRCQSFEEAKKLIAPQS